MSYSQTLDKVILTRFRYAATLTAIVLLPSLGAFPLYPFLLASTLALFYHKLWFLHSTVCYDNADLSTTNIASVLRVSSRLASKLLLNTIISVLYFTILRTRFFSLPFLLPHKHSLPRVSSDNVFYWCFALSLGLLNTIFCAWFNEDSQAVNFVKYRNTSKQLLQSYFSSIHIIVSTVVARYTLALIAGVIVLRCSSMFFSIPEAISAWASIMKNVSNIPEPRHFGVLFEIRLIFFALVLKLVVFFVDVVIFNSYILLGGLHFNLLISSYTPDSEDVNVPLLITTLEDKDNFLKLSALQEIAFCAKSKKPEFYNKLTPLYNKFVSFVEKSLQENIDILAPKLKKPEKEEKKPVSIPGKSEAPNVLKIEEKDVMKKEKVPFVKATLNSISTKFLLSIQDKNDSESVAVVEFVKETSQKIGSIAVFFKERALQYLRIRSSHDRSMLANAVIFYYLMKSFILIVRNSALDPKLNNMVLSLIEKVLIILQKGMKFCEDYVDLNKVNEQAVLNAGIHPFYKQYSNQYLVASLHKLLRHCFVEIICKYSDILGELNLDKNVLELSKKLLLELDKGEKQDVVEISVVY